MSAVSPKLSIRNLDLAGKRLFLRVDFNVPLDGALVSDDTRIRETLPTIRLALDKGASVVLASHLGRPLVRQGGAPDPKYSTRPVADVLAALLGRPVQTAPDCVGEEVEARCTAMKSGDILLLENLRFHPEEQAGDEAFAKRLARLADLYANDAFGTCHRADASVAALPRQFDRPAAGLLIEREVNALGKILNDPARPFVAILGGAKVSDKLPVLTGLLPKVDAMLIGGAMAYTFLSAAGQHVGDSRVEPELCDDVTALMASARERGVKILLPVDHVVATGITEADAASARIVSGSFEAATDGAPANIGVDIGPATRAAFALEVSGARSILWNGPMGVFEVDAFAAGTRAVAAAVAASSAFSVVGGGDSVAALNDAGLGARVSHVSTGGGALLELLAGEPMPGLEALAPA